MPMLLAQIKQNTELWAMARAEYASYYVVYFPSNPFRRAA